MKKITIDPLDPASVRKALAALEKYERDVEKAVDVYTKELASIGREAAYWAYSPAGVQLDVERIDNGHKIVAKHDQIMFLEFGAGVTTQDHELSKPLGVPIEPGSWSDSEEGAKVLYNGELVGTYQAWVKSGGRLYAKKDGSYRYNRQPRAGMLEAYKAIANGAKEAAKEAAEVFE